MACAVALFLLTLSAAACSYDYTPPDTSGGYSSRNLVAVFERECVEEHMSLEKGRAMSTNGMLCFGDEDCERSAREGYSWRPHDAEDVEILMATDAARLSLQQGDGVHCWMRFWRRPDDAFASTLGELAHRNGLTRVSTWSQRVGENRVTWTLWKPEDSEIPELRLIQEERPGPWTLGFIE